MKIRIADLEPPLSVFEELEKIVPGSKLFTFSDGAVLDSLYLYRYGDRYTITNPDSAKIAQYCKMVYSDKWDSAFDLISAADTVMGDLGSARVETVTHKYKYTDRIKDTDSVASYDSPELATDTQNDKTLIHSELGDGTDNTDGINIKETVTDSRDITKYKTSYEYLLHTWIYDIVYRDLNDLITIKIHN